MKADRVIAVRTNKTVYRDGDRCVKVFNSEYSGADVLNEALNQARAEEAGIKVPKVLEVGIVDGKWAISSEYIKGKSLEMLMAEEPEKKDEYLELMVDLQLSIHGKGCALLTAMRDTVDRKICESELEAVDRYDLHDRLAGMPKNDKICHGDFRPSNIIIAQDGTRYVIDWAHATKGNGSADAARTYLLLLFKGDADGAEKYLELFCDKANVTADYVKKWIPIVAACRSVDGNEAERNFMLSQLK